MKDIPLMDPETSEKGSQLLQLFARHIRELRAYSRLILPSVDPIDDVMQEASIVIWKKQEQLRNEEEFLPWAKTIVRNISFRHRRKAVTDRHVFDDELVDRILHEEESEHDGEAGADSKEYCALMACLNKLPDDRRQLILAPYGKPGTVKEIAEQSTRSPNSLYKLLQRLRLLQFHQHSRRTRATGGIPAGAASNPGEEPVDAARPLHVEQHVRVALELLEVPAVDRPAQVIRDSPDGLVQFGALGFFGGRRH